MNKLKAFIPNLLTLGNLLCGLLAIYHISQIAVDDNIIRCFYFPIQSAIHLIFLALLLDFLDGFVARLLKVDGEIGKQLDSLADMVTFGVVPGLIMFYALNDFGVVHEPMETETMKWITKKVATVPLCLIIPLAAAYRLAKFNIDTEQSVNFKGLATPAMTIFVIGLYYLSFSFKEVRNPFLLSTISVILSFLMVSNIPMFSLKAKNFSWKDNWFRYILLIVSVILLIWLKLAAFAIIIPFYIVLSLVARKSFV